MVYRSRFVVGASIGAMTAAERAKGRYMRAPDGHDAGGGGGDGGDTPAAGGGGDTVPAGGGADTVQGGDGGDGGAGDPEWLAMFSGEGGDGDNPSNRDWLKAAGYKDLDGIAKSLRDNIKSVRDSGRIKVPGDGAAEAEIEAFHKAIGRPDKPEDYGVAVPDGHEIEEAFLSPMREIAWKAGMPKGAFEQLADGYIKYQLDQLDALAAREDAAASAKQKEWGDQATENMAIAQRAIAHLGWSQQEAMDIQRSIGSGRFLDMMKELGGGLAEDRLLGGEKRRFGVTGEQAQAEIDRLVGDAEFAAKLEAKDPAAVARWQRLNGAVAAAQERKDRAAAAA